MRAVRRNFDVARLVVASGIYFIALNDRGRRAIELACERGDFLAGRDGVVPFLNNPSGNADTFQRFLSDEGAFTRDLTARELDDIGLLPSYVRVTDAELERVISKETDAVEPIEEQGETPDRPDVTFAFMLYEDEAAERAREVGIIGYVGIKEQSERARRAIAAHPLFGIAPDDFGLTVDDADDLAPTVAMAREEFERMGLSVTFDAASRALIGTAPAPEVDAVRARRSNGEVAYTPVSERARKALARFEILQPDGSLICDTVLDAIEEVAGIGCRGGLAHRLGTRVFPVDARAAEILGENPRAREEDGTLVFNDAGAIYFEMAFRALGGTLRDAA